MHIYAKEVIMDINIKAAAAFYTSNGIKADSVQAPRLAKYRTC